MLGVIPFLPLENSEPFLTIFSQFRLFYETEKSTKGSIRWISNLDSELNIGRKSGVTNTVMTQSEIWLWFEFSKC